ncbi:MAG TPA: hypothetical protein VF880_13770, partial [Actinomycetes bacterium]
WEARAPEELLARVLSRDGSKTLASDTPDVVDARRLSTAELRAERDRLAQLRAECPPDRSRELHLATQRAAEAEQARQQALQEQKEAAEQLATVQGRLLRRRDLQAVRDRRALAEHALQTTSRQADQAAERLGVLRRAQQRRLGWLEAHDEELRLQERAVAREAAWRRRVDQRTLALDPPTWLLAELGPVPADPQERQVWRTAAAELDAYRRAYGLDHDRPAEHGGGRTARAGRAVAPATAPTAQPADETGDRRERHGRGERAHRRGDLGRRPIVADRGRRADPERLLGAQPRRDRPGRRRDWQLARAALEHLAGWDRHRDHRDHRDQRQPNRERLGRTVGRDLGRQERDGR